MYRTVNNWVMQVDMHACMQVRWVNLRKEGPRLAGDQAALLALAQALVGWNENNAFCGRTGAPTAAMQGGHARSVMLSIYTLCWRSIISSMHPSSLSHNTSSLSCSYLQIL